MGCGVLYAVCTTLEEMATRSGWVGWMGSVEREAQEGMEEEKGEAVEVEGRKQKMETARECRWGTSRHH